MMKRHRRFAVTVMRLAAMALAAIAGGSAQRADRVSRTGDQDDRAIAGGRSDRRDGAPDGAEDAAGAGAERDHRKSRRRRRRARRADRGRRRTRRLYLVLRQHQYAGRDSRGVEERGLRSGEELRAGRKRVGKLHDPGRASLIPGQDHSGVSRLRQGESRQAQLCPCRRRQRDASHRGNVPHTRRHRLRQRAAQGRKRIGPGRPGQPGRLRVGKPGDPASADQGGQAAGARASPAGSGRRRSPMFRPWSRAESTVSLRRC